MTLDLFQDLSPAAFVTLPSLQAGDGVLQPREAVLDVVPSLSLLQLVFVRLFDVWELLENYQIFAKYLKIEVA